MSAYVGMLIGNIAQLKCNILYPARNKHRITHRNHPYRMLNINRPPVALKEPHLATLKECTELEIQTRIQESACGMDCLWFGPSKDGLC